MLIDFPTHAPGLRYVTDDNWISELGIHYRLGKLADPVMAAIVDAVRHALTHVDTVHRDGERLKKRTGCCVPAPGDVAGVSCCPPKTVALTAGRDDARTY